MAEKLRAYEPKGDGRMTKHKIERFQALPDNRVTYEDLSTLHSSRKYNKGSVPQPHVHFYCKKMYTEEDMTDTL